MDANMECDKELGLKTAEGRADKKSYRHCGESNKRKGQGGGETADLTADP